MWQNHVTCERESEITKELVERGRKSGGGIQAHKQKQIQTHTLAEREIESNTKKDFSITD